MPTHHLPSAFDFLQKLNIITKSRYSGTGGAGGAFVPSIVSVFQKFGKIRHEHNI